MSLLLLNRPRSPMEEANPLKGSQVSVRLRSGVPSLILRNRHSSRRPRSAPINHCRASPLLTAITGRSRYSPQPVTATHRDRPRFTITTAPASPPRPPRPHHHDRPRPPAPGKGRGRTSARPLLCPAGSPRSAPASCAAASSGAAASRGHRGTIGRCGITGRRDHTGRRGHGALRITGRCPLSNWGDWSIGRCPSAAAGHTRAERLQHPEPGPLTR
jgi:hypothetical protein